MDEIELAANELTGRRVFLRNTSLLTLGEAAGVIPRAGWSAENDVLHIRTYNDLKSPDPATMLSGAEGLISNFIYLNLVRFKQGCEEGDHEPMRPDTRRCASITQWDNELCNNLRSVDVSKSHTSPISLITLSKSLRYT